jgi:hypothetical protein
LTKPLTCAYWIVFLALVAWFVVSGLHLIPTSIWTPLFLMMVLDWIVTWKTGVHYVFAAFMMMAILLVMIFDLFVVPRPPYPIRSAFLVLAFLIAFVAYELLLWRKVLSRPR